MISPAVKLGFVTLPLFLAESSTMEVKSSALGEWLVIGAAVLVIIQIGTGFIDRVRGGNPEKRQVSFADVFTTREEHDALRDEVAKIDTERRVSVAGLHKKIDENTQMTAEIKGQLSGFNQQLQQINIHLINRVK